MSAPHEVAQVEAQCSLRREGADGADVGALCRGGSGGRQYAMIQRLMYERTRAQVWMAVFIDVLPVLLVVAGIAVALLLSSGGSGDVGQGAGPFGSR